MRLIPPKPGDPRSTVYVPFFMDLSRNLEHDMVLWLTATDWGRTAAELAAQCADDRVDPTRPLPEPGHQPLIFGKSPALIVRNAATDHQPTVNRMNWAQPGAEDFLPRLARLRTG